MSTVVIGVGNRFRRDDGLGPLALDRLAARLAPETALVESDAEPGRLLDAWDGVDLAVVVEAVRHGAACGALFHQVVTDHRAVETVMRNGAGTHELGLGAAVALGRTLGRMPRRLVIAGLEPCDLGYGEGLSDPVAAALPSLVDLVVADVRAGRMADVH